MLKEEFIQRIKEDKFFENPKELIEYRLPVVQYYLTNYVNTSLQIDNFVINSKDITIKYNPLTDFTLVNYAYERILERFKGGL